MQIPGAYTPHEASDPGRLRWTIVDFLRRAGLHATGTRLLPGRAGRAVYELIGLPDDDLTVGRWSYFSSVPHVVRYPGGGPEERIEVGAFCSISDDVTFVLSGNHDPRRVTTSPVRTFLGGEDMASTGEVSGRGGIHIGNDVWIGRGAWLLSGTVIGDGAVVGGRAVVAGHVEPYAIVVGSPAREIRRRFDERTIARLRASVWWDLPDAVLREALDLLSGHDIEAFLEHVEALSDHT